MDGEPSADDLESMTMFSEEAQEISEEQQEVDDEKMYQNMPWLRVCGSSFMLTTIFIW